MSKNRFMTFHEAAILEFAPFTVNAATYNQSLGINTDYSKHKKSFNISCGVFIFGSKVGDLDESDLPT